MPTLIGKTLINKSLPGKKEILQSTGRAIVDILRNPVNAIREGIARDKLAVQTYKNLTGHSRTKAAKILTNIISKGVYKGGGKDLIVNTGGVAGSIAGANIGGKLGSLGGDWLGAATTRKALDDTEALHKALKIRNNPAFKRLSAKNKLDIVRKRLIGFAKKNSKSFNEELKKDSIGWVIGNSSADTLRAVGSKIPLQGGAIAIGTVPSVHKGIKIGVKRGRKKGWKKGIDFGIGSVKRNLQKTYNIKRQISKSLNREKRMVDSVNKELQKLPNLPSGTNFKRNYYFLVDFNVSSNK